MRRRKSDRRMVPSAAAASVAITAGTAAAQNTSRIGVPCASSSPPTIGPTIDPMRPMPSAQPTPVDRIARRIELGRQRVRARSARR